MGRRDPASRTKVAKSRSRKRKRGRQARSGYQSPKPARRTEPQPTVEPAKRGRDREERPPAPWGSFPLQELSVLVGLVVLVVGAIRGAPGLVTIGVGITCLGALELTLREHLAGYRSHSMLLSGVVFVIVVGGFFYFSGLILLVCLGIGAVAFTAMLFWMRSVFRRASGGLSFKVGGLRG